MSLYSLIYKLSRDYNFNMEKDIKYILGRNIKAERVRKNYTQEVFAEKINMSVSYVSKLEQGLTSPSALAIYKMSMVLETPFEEFFKGIDISLL